MEGEDHDMAVANAVHIKEDQGTGAAAAADAEAALAEGELGEGELVKANWLKTNWLKALSDEG